MTCGRLVPLLALLIAPVKCLLIHLDKNTRQHNNTVPTGPNQDDRPNPWSDIILQIIAICLAAATAVLAIWQGPRLCRAWNALAARVGEHNTTDSTSEHPDREEESMSTMHLITMPPTAYII